jgi:hypothetical protein
MAEVLVLGGYGELGFACVREIADAARVGITIAGRSVQKAEEAALACGENVRGVYANASDPRTLGSLIPATRVVVCCSGARAAEALAVSLDHRVPFVGVSPVPLPAHTATELGRRAWEGQVPVVLGAGAIPGLPGVMAEYRVRRTPEIGHLRIVTTGPWRGTPRAEEDAAWVSRNRFRVGARPFLGDEFAPRRWQFPDPVGTWPVRPVRGIDLEGFETGHCVHRLTYLEAEPGPVARALLRFLGRDAGPATFAAIAEAWRSDPADPGPDRVEIEAPDVIEAAAAATGVIVRAILAGQVPPGLHAQREAMNPGQFLSELRKRDFEIRFSREEV